MSREKSVAEARQRVLQVLARDREHYRSIICDHGADHVDVWPPGDIPNYGERLAATEEAIAMLRAAWALEGT